MWMIVGLGNPGSKYALTRHNVGFMVIDMFLKSIGNPHESNAEKALVAKFKWDDENIITVKPQGFMNLSGESVQPLLNFYKVSQENLIVVHDDIDQPFGSIKIQKNRGHGGHNGIRDISEKLGNADYLRLKIGVGRPVNPEHAVADYVLGKFSSEEMTQLPDYLNKSCDALEAIVFEGLAKASTKFNGVVF